MKNTVIEKLLKKDVDETARMLALAFRQNPNMKAIWQDPGTPGALRAVEGLMKVAKLKRKYSNVYVAKIDNRIAGAINYAIWPHCQPSGADKLGMLPKLMSFGSKLPRALSVLTAWEKHDPKKPHFHIGPLAVLPEYQGKGIGSALLKHCIDIADKKAVPCYLETDAPENLPLYRRHGFLIMKEVPIHDFPTWIMWRDVKAGQTEGRGSTKPAGDQAWSEQRKTKKPSEPV